MKVTLEVPTIADAVTRAARVAPTKGQPSLVASGVLLELRPGQIKPLIVKATDLEITYRQEVSVVDIEGTEERDWRVNAMLLSGILSAMPMGSGSAVTLEEDETTGFILIKCGRKKVRLPRILTEFPLIPQFDPEKLVTVVDFAHSVTQVAWACSHGEQTALAGVHITGDVLVGCDRKSMAMTPCPMPVDKPITVPLAPILALLKNVGDVKLAADNGKLLLMPDADTQITSTIYAAEYVQYQRVQRDTATLSVELNRQQLIDSVQATLVLVKGEKMPYVGLTFIENEVAVEMNVEEVGLIEDVVDAMNGPDEPFAIYVTPQSLMGALGGASKDVVKLQFGPSNSAAIIVSDDTGYRSDIMPRVIASSVAGAPSAPSQDASAA